jgi:sodium-dependent dicarboxylate transporter 2/3/5
MTNARPKGRFDVKRILYLLLGVGLFFLLYLSPDWPDAVDPKGVAFDLSPQGKAALALFLLAATWWVTEVVPIGVTSIMIGVVQALFLIRPGVLPVPPDSMPKADLVLVQAVAPEGDEGAPPQEPDWIQIELSGADWGKIRDIDAVRRTGESEAFARKFAQFDPGSDDAEALVQVRMAQDLWSEIEHLRNVAGKATVVASRHADQVQIRVSANDWKEIEAAKKISGSWRSFTDFLAPSVWFIFGSLSFGMVFTKTGLTRRLAYKMLALVGEKTSMIYLGCFVMTAAMTLIMAHTAVAATLYPLLLAIYSMYTNEEKPTRFGKGLFMGMAFVAGAGSIITLLGAARGAVALGFFREITGVQVGFFELTYYMAPVGLTMVLLLWGFFMVWYKPERKTIPGLRERSTRLYAELGPMKKHEWMAISIVGTTILVLGVRALLPEGAMLRSIDTAGIILVATLLFFVFRILRLDDLEDTSWNIILLFGGAMSIGYCLWQTGAASWLAINWLTMFETAPGWVFVVGIAFFVLMMTNLIMNVAAIAISMPVALVIAPYLDVAPHVVMFASLATAGMPFLLLVGAAPNAIAYASKQFTSREFFIAGIPASLLLMVVVTVFVLVVWPLMGMPVSLD